MKERTRYLALAAVVAVTTGVVGVAERRSCAAAWRAFRDPELVEGERARPASASAPMPARRLADEERGPGERPVEEDPLADLRPHDLEIPISKRTLHYVHFFAEDERGRRWFESLFRRSGRYRATIENALVDLSLPKDLVWLVAAESGFDATTTSPAQAAGLWQLMPALATSYGLTINDWVDERRNVEASTRVAVDHLRKLFTEYGAADLALAAYNMGSAGLDSSIDELRQLRQDRREAPRRVDVAELTREDLIPRETQEYVPRIAAMAIVAANADRLGFRGLVRDEELRTASVLVPPETRLSTIARAAHVGLERIRELNPELIAEATPPGVERAVAVPAEEYSQAAMLLAHYVDEDARSYDALAPEPVEADPEPPTTTGLELSLARLELAQLELSEPLWQGNSLLPGFAYASAGFDPLKGARKLPMVWVGSFEGGRGARTKPSDAHIEAELGFLSAPAVEAETIGPGITLRLERHATASRIAVTVELSSGDGASGDAGAAWKDAPISSTMVHEGRSETRYVDVLRPTELDIGLSLAIGRLALMVEQARSAPVATLRARLGRRQRADIEALPQGRAWLALGDAMFPLGSPSFGRVIDPRGQDAAAVRDRLLLSELAADRAPSLATITVAGNFEPDEVRRLVGHALAAVSLRDGGDTLAAPASHQLEVADDTSPPIFLVGQILPPIDAVDHAAALVVLEILAGKKKSVLVRELLDSGVATSVNLLLDSDWVASAGVIAVEPREANRRAKIVEVLDEALARLADEGPTRDELAYAVGMIDYRVRRKLAQVDTLEPKAIAPSAARMLEALRPGKHQELLKRVGVVDVRAVKRAVRAYYGATSRYVVELRSEATAVAATP